MRALTLLHEAECARQVVDDAMEEMRQAAMREDWIKVEALRTRAVASFEALLDASIASQRETVRHGD